MTDAPAETAALAASMPPPAEALTDPAQDFEQLLVGVLPAAFSAAMHLTRNRQDAEDLVQEAALRAFRGFAGFRTGTNFRAWFLRVLLNQFRSSLRTQRQLASIDDVEETHPLYLYSRAAESGVWGPEQDPARAFMDRMTAADVARALAAIPEPYRVVATLYFTEDLPYQEIAEILEVPIGTVRSRLHRGRALLQKQLWNLAEDQGLVSGPAPESDD